MADLPKPLEDGITHINIYSKSKDPLGNWLSNFTHTPFEHPAYGRFESMEGYWYWCATGMNHHMLKQAWGFKAKEMGKEYKRVRHPDFQKMIKQGIRLKINQHPEWKNRFRASMLPFKHYYVFGDPRHDRSVVIEPKGSQWLVTYFEELRAQMKKDFKPGE